MTRRTIVFSDLAKIALFTLFAAATIVNCSFSFGNYGFDGKPDPNELTGVWTLTADARRVLSNSRELGLTKLAPEQNVIEMRKDGTCLFNTYWSFTSDEYYINARGKWKLEHEEYSDFFRREMWKVSFELEPRPSNYVVATFFLDNRNGKLKMFDFAGDPDEHKFVVFEKTQ